ncbi:hypothetical protein NTE_01276 [Candidatus Nitrososphaera evergladensis SR1]|jgi:hypothetical protein|uniref:DUF2171 domain-containing protein n=1 Tax=Candidatus Nitrososphaera evergladensis SR1 TaxID=1459636 RepID=A0A075MQI7_9ARCH|nr:hypothetical protein [Candidatus Nitrososphaera evergladensis]AIF83345.1 hypothetical protein NTE_01276 [Candidatus Nitrososphaera evergladensis SR1]
MSEPAILNWERVMHKNVRSHDGVDVGTIIADDADTVTIYKGSGREYKLPKTLVEGFNGAEVWLGVTYRELMSYKIQ